jgi:hypothetical protein
MSASARREVFLTPGRYTLQVRGSFWLNDVGGVYVVKLGCGAGAATRLVNKSDPGGMVINPRTGAFSGTPLQVGTDYRMQLHAIDAVQGPTVLAEFNFDVVDPVFALTPRWTGVDAFNATRGIDGQYHVSQVRAAFTPFPDIAPLCSRVQNPCLLFPVTAHVRKCGRYRPWLHINARSLLRSAPPRQIHALEPPGLSKRQLFANPANGDFDGIVYFLLVNVSSVGGCRGSDAFSNAVTGCVGAHRHAPLPAPLHLHVRP